jgi:SAM-dependent methyltransferase
MSMKAHVEPVFLRRYYPESQFGGFTDVDATIAFYTRVNAMIDPAAVVLDVGCGRGSYAEDPVSVRRELRCFKGKCRRVIGIDPDDGARGNPCLDEFRLMTGAQWPLPDRSVDLCLADTVLEHVEVPELFFSECRRVLRPGGHLCLRTPNVWSYVGLFSRLIPNRYHAALLGRVQNGRKREDVFATHYRCSTRRKIHRMLDRYGFDGYVYPYEAEPSYLSFSRFFYALGVLHQRLVPGIFKPVLFAFGRKRDDA